MLPPFRSISGTHQPGDLERIFTASIKFVR